MKSTDRDSAATRINEATIPGVVVAGPVAAPLQDYTNYDAALLASAANRDAATAFLKFVTGKAAAATGRQPLSTPCDIK